MGPANERQRYIVKSSIIGWAHIQNDPWWYVFHPITWVVVRFQTFNVNESYFMVDNLESYTTYNISIQAVIQGSQYPGNIISGEHRTAPAGNGLISTWEKSELSV